MNDITAVLDSCVLYPAPLRDFLMHLALLDLFRARWTEEIHEEWIRNVLKSRPDLTIEQLTRTKELMNAHTRDSVVAGYENLSSSIVLPDAGDRHVLAAAIHAEAEFIVTFNLRDFPATVLAPAGVEAIHPDAFLELLLERDAEKVLLAAERQRQSLKNPPKSPDEFYQTLEMQGLNETVKILRLMFEEKQ
ncbi:MAG: PIN domain-containing protein [Acidobacteriota bacterium]|nr:PIN domain-containing protein [Acidobacteriota bacterium]